MVVNLMFRGGNYYSSVPGETPVNKEEKREKNGKYTERDVEYSKTYQLGRRK